MEDNQHPYKTTSPDGAKVVREGNKVHINMISIRSHFTP